MILTAGNRSTGEETCPSINMSTTQPTQKALGLKQASAVRGRRLIAPMASSKFSNHLVQRLVQNTYSAAQ